MSEQKKKALFAGDGKNVQKQKEPDTTAMIARLRSQTDEAGSTWTPSPDDALVGIIVGADVVNTKYGERNIIRVRSEIDSVVYTVFCNVVLFNKISKCGAKSGDRIGILYKGLNKNYHDYNVIVESEEF